MWFCIHKEGVAGSGLFLLYYFLGLLSIAIAFKYSGTHDCLQTKALVFFDIIRKQVYHNLNQLQM